MPCVYVFECCVWVHVSHTWCAQQMTTSQGYWLHDLHDCQLCCTIAEAATFSPCCLNVRPLQIKRIHEYKRQYLNILSIIYRYKQLKAMSPAERKAAVPRVCVIGGKVGVVLMRRMSMTWKN